MKTAIEVLAASGDRVFPVIIGEQTEETPLIRQRLETLYGSSFILDSCAPQYMGTYYAAADLFFSASSYEAFGLVYVEALWHGLPLVCHGHAGLRGIVGDHASIMNMNVVHSAQKEWLQILEQLTVGTSLVLPHQFVQEQYSWAALRTPYIEMYTTAVNR
jgi:glycosyltransferase involved in cell wall biosynthesis